MSTRDGNHITVAIDLSELDKDLIKTAAHLCKKSGLSLRLIHVCQRQFGSVDSTWGSSVPLEESQVHPDEQDVYLAERHFDDLMQNIDSSIPVTKEYLVGEIANAILKDISATHPSLIICGHTYGNRPWYSCSSLAATLRAHVAIPVLSLPPYAELPTLNSAPRILVADDLRAESAGVIKVAFAFAELLETTKIRHIYATLEPPSSPSRTAIENRQSLTPPETQSQRKQELIEICLSRLMQRAAYESSFHPNIHYEAAVLFGQNILTILKTDVVRYGAHLVCCGRHRGIHHSIPFFGKLATDRFAVLRTAVMTIPSTKPF